jgi:hypothetical protein
MLKKIQVSKPKEGGRITPLYIVERIVLQMEKDSILHEDSLNHASQY